MKSNIIKVLCLAALTIGVSGTTQAQFRHFRQSVYLNGALPTGQFGNHVDASHTTVPLTYTQAGKDAVLGFGLGYRASYRFDIGMGEVSPFLGADVFWNMIGGDWRDAYLDANMDAPSYFNIPVLAGISYCYDELNTQFPVIPFGEFGVGADMMIITHEGTSVKADANNYYAYKPSTTVAWMIGAGVYLGNYVSVGAYYFGLGKHPVDYTSRTIDRNPVAAAQVALAEGRQTRTAGTFALRVGFHF